MLFPFSCVAQLSPIVFVGLLPKNKQEQLELQRSTESSARAGMIFVIVAGGSILFTLVQAIYELIYEV